MKRVQEKIKDLVDVRNYEIVKNFDTDPTATVTAYRFTDATADLMAKWLDEIVELSHRSAGAARALAGNRGVGKSHFLAALAALTAHPDLRPRLTDTHVAASAQRLPRQKYLVVNVERGLESTLAAELNGALNKTFGEEQFWGDTPAAMLALAAERARGTAGDLPVIVVIDSARDRAARVKRDDGAILGETARAAIENKMFVAIALDDDIAGADGVNAAIARTYTIDFLDQEHLYRIVDSFLLPKRPPARAILHDLYQGFREASPGFNWSEPRFAALYPIHPVIVDVTPAVRLYAPKFAFLPFAAETAGKVMNRPAHSLLALDEVFDKVEPDLRKAPELAETFAVYDELAVNAVARIPVMQRLQAKLILKGLLITSLDGRGASARELAAAMLIYDENQPAAAVAKVAETLGLFAQATPEKIRQTNAGEETSFCLINSVGASFESKLASAAQDVAEETVTLLLRRIGQARFADWVFGDFAANSNENARELHLQWRGSVRRGQIVWNWDKNTPPNAAVEDNLDWQISIIAPGAPIIAPANINDAPVLTWQPAAMRPEEIEAVRRFAALLTSHELTEEFGDTASAAGQTTAAIVERIWTRTFLEDGKFFSGQNEQPVASEARSTRTLTEMLEMTFAPVFAAHFPAHPAFAELLTTAEVSRLVSDVFGGANINSGASSAAAQTLAQTFAEPLGLAVQRGGNWLLETDENLLKLPTVIEILKLTGAANGAGVLLTDLHQKLRAAPHGLAREAQNLILSALVARRRLEFVTANKDRITHRSLDLKIIWADVIGAAQSSVQPRTAAELVNWAKLLTGDESLTSIAELTERGRVIDALRNWLAEWQTARILENFELLPDDAINVRAWRLAGLVKRSFGAAAAAIENSGGGEKTALEDVLERIIDAFGDAPETLPDKRAQMSELQNFLAATTLRQTVWRYTARAEMTDDAEIESLRERILDELSEIENAFNEIERGHLQTLWDEFRQRYAEFYARRHDDVLHRVPRRQMLEKIESSVEFQEFQRLAKLPIVPPNFDAAAADIRRQIKAVECRYKVRDILETEPFCACGVRLRRAAALDDLPQKFAQNVMQGRAAARRTLQALAAPLSGALEEISRTEPNREHAARAGELTQLLRKNEELPILTALDVGILSAALRRMPAPTLRIKPPRNLGANEREDLRLKLNQWLDNLPNSPVLIKFADDE